MSTSDRLYDSLDKLLARYALHWKLCMPFILGLQVVSQEIQRALCDHMDHWLYANGYRAYKNMPPNFEPKGIKVRVN